MGVYWNKLIVSHISVALRSLSFPLIAGSIAIGSTLTELIILLYSSELKVI
jgi:hypothetical protein